jgi:L-2-hydroxyglutarate oxidase LhgO
MRLGPHFIWSNTLDYTVNDEFLDLFYNEASKYLTFLEPEDISVDSSGFMSAVQVPGGHMADFIIREEKDRGLPGFINLVGIESPGLTASPAIAEYVESLL